MIARLPSKLSAGRNLNIYPEMGVETNTIYIPLDI